MCRFQSSGNKISGSLPADFELDINAAKLIAGKPQFEGLAAAKFLQKIFRVAQKAHKMNPVPFRSCCAGEIGHYSALNQFIAKNVLQLAI